MRRVGQQANDDEDEQAYLPDGMPEIRGFERSDQEAGEAGDGRSDAPMDIAMDKATTATSTTMETAGITQLSRRRLTRRENGD
jgi:hypothetical protein